jgi:hypothetical protein
MKTSAISLARFSEPLAGVHFGVREHRQLQDEIIVQSQFQELLRFGYVSRFDQTVDCGCYFFALTHD